MHIEALTQPHLAALRTTLIAGAKDVVAKGKRRGARSAGTTKRAAVTTNTYVKNIKTLLNHLRAHGTLPALSKDAIADALKPLPLPHEQAEYLAPSQLQKLLEAAQRHDAATFEETREEHAGLRLRGTTPRYASIAPFTAFLLLTGCRRGEPSYAPITRSELGEILARLSELAVEDGIELRLRITGGAVMLIEFQTRTSGTRDVDVLRAVPADKVAEYAAVIAKERGWPDRWLNDSAKLFEERAPIHDTEDVELRRLPGLVLTRPSLRRLLAWKLARYIDDTDRADALELLRCILAKNPYDLEDLWIQLEGHLAPDERQEAYYNLQDAWEELNRSA